MAAEILASIHSLLLINLPVNISPELPWTTFEDLQLSDKKSDLRSKSNIYPKYQDIQTWVTALRLQLGQPHQTQNDV